MKEGIHEMIIDRIYIIQKIIEHVKARTYLEIGVREGECFLRIKARRKIAVDPQMHITPTRKRKYIFRYFFNLFNRYVRLTSDDYFMRERELLKRTGLDVIFIDGLHTYEQSLKDVLNALEYLNPGGVIIMHDCNPSSEAAALPAASYEHAANILGFSGEWNGDVWKTIVHLRSSRKDLDVFVLDCDQGLGIIARREPEAVLSFTPGEIDRLSYKDLDASRRDLLNLKSQEYIYEFIRTL